MICSGIFHSFPFSTCVLLCPTSRISRSPFQCFPCNPQIHIVNLESIRIPGFSESVNATPLMMMEKCKKRGEVAWLKRVRGRGTHHNVLKPGSKCFKNPPLFRLRLVCATYYERPALRVTAAAPPAGSGMLLNLANAVPCDAAFV